MAGKRRILTQEEKDFIIDNWDGGEYTRQDVYITLRMSPGRFYIAAEELGLKFKKGIRGGKHGVNRDFWKPYLNKLLKKNSPFIAQLITEEKSKLQWLKRYIRRMPEIRKTNIKKHRDIVYTVDDKCRVEAWELCLKKNVIVRNKSYLSRFGHAILGKNYYGYIYKSRYERKGGRKMVHLYCVDKKCLAKLESIRTTKQKTIKNVVYCPNCKRLYRAELKEA